MKPTSGNDRFQEEIGTYVVHCEQYYADSFGPDGSLSTETSNRQRLSVEADESETAIYNVATNSTNTNPKWSIGLVILAGTPAIVENSENAILDKADEIIRANKVEDTTVTVEEQRANTTSLKRVEALVRASTLRNKRTMDSILSAAACVGCRFVAKPHDLETANIEKGSWQCPSSIRRRNAYRSCLAPSIQEEQGDSLVFQEDTPEAVGTVSTGAFTENIVTSTSSFYHKSLSEPTPIKCTLDDRERFFDEAEKLIMESKMPADREQALAALSRSGSIDTNAYRCQLIDELRIQREHYRNAKRDY